MPIPDYSPKMLMRRVGNTIPNYTEWVVYLGNEEVCTGEKHSSNTGDLKLKGLQDPLLPTLSLTLHAPNQQSQGLAHYQIRTHFPQVNGKQVSLKQKQKINKNHNRGEVAALMLCAGDAPLTSGGFQAVAPPACSLACTALLGQTSVLPKQRCPQDSGGLASMHLTPGCLGFTCQCSLYKMATRGHFCNFILLKRFKTHTHTHTPYR